ETDTNHDGLISMDEFMQQTSKEEFQKDPEWKTIDQQPQFTHEEYLEFERRRQEEVQHMIAQGQLPPHPNMPQGYYAVPPASFQAPAQGAQMHYQQPNQLLEQQQQQYHHQQQQYAQQQQYGGSQPVPAYQHPQPQPLVYQQPSQQQQPLPTYRHVQHNGHPEQVSLLHQSNSETPSLVQKQQPQDKLQNEQSTQHQQRSQQQN
ncbi:PREDICTED: nuclear transcription factor Y subunit beta-like, partial [Drosophila arizonae]|uniref:Nuclear transcription factor Y subunit beta-like n=1 Tax=Drosophila arizonae TaxID=7263 RepID=A0ABM1Q0G1_DROAR